MGGEIRNHQTETAVDDDGSLSYDVSSRDRTWGILVHASAFIGMLVPMGHIIGPLLIWLIKKEESPFVDANGKEAVNFQISMTIYLVIAGFLVVVLIGLVIIPLLLVAWFALVAIASIRASNEQVYRYPATIRLIS